MKKYGLQCCGCRKILTTGTYEEIVDIALEAKLIFPLKDHAEWGCYHWQKASYRPVRNP